jgi:hypothetical protein
MKRYLACCFISCYLLTLSWGLVAHSFKMGALCHPLMYFIVWDMFCGWQAYDYNQYYIAEAIDGNYYQVDPAPWGSFKPYSDFNRNQYDYRCFFTAPMVKHVLEKTAHPPINRVLVIEEFWNKKYNIPDPIYRYAYGREKDQKKYFSLRATLDHEGNYLTRNLDFENSLAYQQFIENPRMKQLMHQGKPFYEVSTSNAGY